MGKRVARKAKGPQRSYGQHAVEKTRKKQSGKKAKKLTQHQLVELGRRAFALGDKKAAKQFNEFFAVQERQAKKAQLAHLLKKIPTLKVVQSELERQTFSRLVKEILAELEDAYSVGYGDAPKGEAPGSSRSDTWSGPPAGSFIVTPYSGPPSPGPSGLS